MKQAAVCKSVALCSLPSDSGSKTRVGALDGGEYLPMLSNNLDSRQATLKF